MKLFLSHNKFVFASFFCGFVFVLFGDLSSIGKSDFISIVKAVCFVLGILLIIFSVFSLNLPPYKNK